METTFKDIKCLVQSRTIWKNTSIQLFLSVKILFDSRLQIYWSDISTHCCMCWVLGEVWAHLFHQTSRLPALPLLDGSEDYWRPRSKWEPTTDFYNDCSLKTVIGRQEGRVWVKLLSITDVCGQWKEKQKWNSALVSKWNSTGQERNDTKNISGEMIDEAITVPNKSCNMNNLSTYKEKMMFHQSGHSEDGTVDGSSVGEWS